MKFVYRLVGYDRKTERLVEKHAIPAKWVRYAQGVARIRPNDPQAIADVPLDASQARDIAGTIGISVDADNREYFLEPYVEKASARQRAHG